MFFQNKFETMLNIFQIGAHLKIDVQPFCHNCIITEVIYMDKLVERKKLENNAGRFIFVWYKSQEFAITFGCFKKLIVRVENNPINI